MLSGLCDGNFIEKDKLLRSMCSGKIKKRTISSGVSEIQYPPPVLVISPGPEVRRRWTRSVAGLSAAAARGWRREQARPGLSPSLGRGRRRRVPDHRSP